MQIQTIPSQQKLAYNQESMYKCCVCEELKFWSEIYTDEETLDYYCERCAETY